MISVIICSVDPQDLSVVKENIEKTIGTKYEIIAFDNSQDQKGICEIYNLGIQRAKYEYLCFMHEDIEMLTAEWGVKVIEIFEKNKELGLFGIAGGGYKSLVPSSWYNADLEINGQFYCNLIQGFKYGGKKEFLDHRNPKNERLSLVATIDGCWMCARKSILPAKAFDQNLLTGFHGYDIDFSLTVGQKHQVAVTYDILLKHFSEGTFSKQWEDAILKIHKKWSRHLPVNVDGLDEKMMLRYERRAFKMFFNRQLNLGSSYDKLIAIIWNARHSRIFGPFKWYKVYADLWRVWRKRDRSIT
ncbi:glycosyltransferase [Dyadobacter arcticus]|uniref:Streptomycin biosynthesis protein StrF domain-containing protein n=1 Tax=Dyadobacter arcticus TaxID=1078754 RepID=A0ABX0UMZ4_9BACT|nr:glycosyltransferase [Dyadobacter arcticus]NIJ54361.1 hypothetical protein [Dyadobacter arcticus]